MKKTVFVVDDNESNLLVTRKALKDRYRVMTVPSAEKLFALLQKVKPDLILLDIKMPEIDGFEALRRLKDNTPYADIPVIFLTHISDASIETRGYQLGCVDFITKPFYAPTLIERIETHLSNNARNCEEL